LVRPLRLSATGGCSTDRAAGRPRSPLSANRACFAEKVSPYYLPRRSTCAPGGQVAFPRAGGSVICQLVLGAAVARHRQDYTARSPPATAPSRGVRWCRCVRGRATAKTAARARTAWHTRLPRRRASTTRGRSSRSHPARSTQARSLSPAGTSPAKTPPAPACASYQAPPTLLSPRYRACPRPRRCHVTSSIIRADADAARGDGEETTKKRCFTHDGVSVSLCT